MARRITRPAAPTFMQAVRHTGDSRVNIPTVELGSLAANDEPGLQTLRYARRESLDPHNLIIEVIGEHRRSKAAWASVAETYWISAMNNRGGLARSSLLEVSDPWDAANVIRAHVAAVARVGAP